MIRQRPARNRGGGNVRGRDGCRADRLACGRVVRVRAPDVTVLRHCDDIARAPDGSVSKDRRRARRRPMPRHAALAIGVRSGRDRAFRAAAPNVAPARGRRPDASNGDPQALHRMPFQCGNEGKGRGVHPFNKARTTAKSPQKPRQEVSPTIITTKETRMSFPRFLSACAALAVAALFGVPAVAADACTNRGELDTMYCDANKDLVADVPDRPQEVEEPVDDRVHLHAGRGSGRLREHLQAVHDAPREVPRQEGRVLPGADQRGGDRGDALGPAARRRLLDRARPRSRSTSPARCRSRSRATRRSSRATT